MRQELAAAPNPRTLVCHVRPLDKGLPHWAYGKPLQYMCTSNANTPVLWHAWACLCTPCNTMWEVQLPAVLPSLPHLAYVSQLHAPRAQLPVARQRTNKYLVTRNL